MDAADPSAEKSVTIDVRGLVRCLVDPESTAEQRMDWARYLLIQEKQTEADLHNLYRSIHMRGGARRGGRTKDGALAHRELNRELNQIRRGIAASSKDEIAEERELLAAEVASLATSAFQELARLRLPSGQPDTKTNDDEQPEVEEGPALQDVLRAGRAPTSRHVEPQPQPDLPSSAVDDSVLDDSIRLCRPRWSPGVDPTRHVQATLRFEPPGVQAGERVLVDGPSTWNGEQLTLLVPPGVMNIERAIACVSATPPTSKADSALRLDIVPLPPDVQPGGQLDVVGVTFLLPITAVPGTSICVALPISRLAP